MNWEAFGAIGEIPGAAAVVVSLIYLAIQIRIQNKESRLAATHKIPVGFRENLPSSLDADLVDSFSLFWELRKQHYDAEFREYVDALPRSSWSLHEVQANDS